MSRRLVEAVKLSPLPQYKIAFACGLHPNTLSKLVCGIQRVKAGDSRVIAIGHALGLTPEECFESADEVAAG